MIDLDQFWSHIKEIHPNFTLIQETARMGTLALHHTTDLIHIHLGLDALKGDPFPIELMGYGSTGLREEPFYILDTQKPLPELTTEIRQAVCLHLWERSCTTSTS